MMMIIIKKYYKSVLLAVLAMMWLSLPSAAHAQLVPDFDNCANNAALFPATAFTSKVVNCVQYTIINATRAMLAAFSGYMTATVAAMFVLAIIVFGMRTLEGEKGLTPKAIGFFLRLGIVGMFSYNLGGNAFVYPGGMVQAIYDMEQQLITLASGNVSPWAQIDYFLGTIIGFSPGIVLSQGLLGVIGSALFSSTAGLAIFIAGLVMVLSLVFFVFDIVYTYLVAMLIIGFLLIISPFIIPLAIFFYTERYFKKWLDMLIATMLMPVLLFAFLNMVMLVINYFICHVMAALGFPCANPYNLSTAMAPDFSPLWRNNIPFTTILMPSDGGFLGSIPPTGVNVPAVPANINPYLRNAVSALAFNFPRLNLGNSPWAFSQSLVTSFIMLFVFMLITKSVVKKIPEIANSIAGSVGVVSFQSAPFTQMVKSAMEKVQSGGRTPT